MVSVMNNLKQALSALTCLAGRNITVVTSKKLHLYCHNTVKQPLLTLKSASAWTRPLLGSSGQLVYKSDKPPDDYSSYDPYQEFETPSPYKRLQPIHFGYEPKYHKRGILPRPKGEYEDIPVKGTKRVFPKDRDAWTNYKGLFGQNDYIDILGDGSVHPARLINAPLYIKAFKGNELERLIRRMKYEGRQMQYMNPTKYNQIQKRIFFLYKRKNNYRKSKIFWGGRREANRGRLYSAHGRFNNDIHPMKFKGW